MSENVSSEVPMSSQNDEATVKVAQKSQKKKRAKAARESARAAEAKKRQIVLRYAEDGTRIGDDGYPMTKARKRLHYTYNALFFLMCGFFVIAAICMINSYFQNQTITEWELKWVGGNMFNGFSVGTLLRIESLFLLFMTAVFLFANQKGMAWMYDRKPKKPVKVTIMLMVIPSALYFIGCAVLVNVIEPVSLVTFILGMLLIKFVADVEREKGSLKKVPVARVVVKK